MHCIRPGWDRAGSFYCTGTRNHLEAAINAEDEMFTFDNTDDGGGWWKRVTHMVDGGFYGYPYDFKPQRPYTLWRMDEYGGGAPTGACAYDEDALPDEYKGNLFLCDWEGEVFRLKVSRSGSTYKIDEKTVFMTKGESDDFKPVGICVSPDGKSLYVTDWGHSFWKRDQKMGRLVKVTYTGKTQETPKPAWFLPAASGEKFEATTPDLVRGLMHPAESVRLVAQRRLAERGHAAASTVLKLLKDGEAFLNAKIRALVRHLDPGRRGRRKEAAQGDPGRVEGQRCHRGDASRSPTGHPFGAPSHDCLDHFTAQHQCRLALSRQHGVGPHRRPGGRAGLDERT